MRPLVVALARLILRLFFRRLEVVGAERVPLGAPVVFTLNHPSALVDPCFILALAGRPVSLLAKEPLFRMPLVGALVRGAGCLPVYRRKDDADPRQNQATFERARELLRTGGSIALFPEGTSHDDAKLRPIKTGAARIALGAAQALAQGPTPLPLFVVPAGLNYSDKGTFRSQALLVFGEPIRVEPQALGPDGEPPREAALLLTAQIERGLAQVTLQAERPETLDAIAICERIFSLEEPPAPGTGGS
ncbi:MAG: lysophospholipid acyltransferase family protein, partial [Deltaproteobacteria bacterium]